MKSLKWLFLLVFVASITGCLDTANGPEIITEHSGRSHYYIVNQTETDLNVSFKIAFLEMDSTVTVLAEHTTKIFESGDIGSSPPPASAFEKLTFFELTNNNTSPLLIIQPIVNESWGVTGEEDAIRFELIITIDDIK